MRFVPRFASFSILAVAASTACAPEPARPKPEHVLVILIDTLRADHLTPYHYSRDTSPAIAELASQGALFENAISQCSWTLPSVVSLMTGQYLSEERWRVPADRATVAEVFKKAGFETAAFVCNDLINDENHFSRGFDVFKQMPPYNDDAPILEWIASSKGRRTFTYVHLNEPHDPYGPGDPALAHFKKSPLDSLPKGRLEFYRQFNADKHLADFDGSVATIETEIGGYDDDVTYSDTHVRHYLDALKANGLLDSTAILLTADHGEGLWTREAYEAGQRYKDIYKNKQTPTLVNVLMNTHGNQVNRELIHVPMILRAPGVKPGTVVAGLVENVDIAPTLFELCDLAAPNALEGESLLPLALDQKHASKPYAFTRTRYVSSVIDRDHMQLILPTPLGECDFALPVELFDLAHDPEARQNLAATNPKLVGELTQIAHDRAKIGLPGESAPMDAKTAELMRQNGYLDNGILEKPPDFSKSSTDELISSLCAPTTLCGLRREIAKALVGRTFDAAQRAKLEAFLAMEVSPNVKPELAKALATK